MFGGIYARGGAARETTSEAWRRAMLDVEQALAPPGAAAAIAAARGEAPPGEERASGAVRPLEGLDIETLGREGARHATPVVPLVRALREAVGPEHAAAVHQGATSQDVLDTAAMLLARRAAGIIAADARAAADAAAGLAARHRDTPLLGRTLLQAAEPTTFGLRAAGWMVALDEARAGLDRVRYAVQLGGPVGTGDPARAERLAAELGLEAPVLPWHTNRVRVAELAGALGALSGTAAKIARDVTLLSGGGEVREGVPGRGESSSMPHKQNPVAAVSTIACATRVPGLVATLLTAMVQEHERAAGTWQAEWGTLSDLLTLTGSALAWCRDMIEHLEVDAAAMAEAAGGGAGCAAAGRLVDRALEARRRQETTG